MLEAWVEFIRNNIKHKGKGKTMTAADTKSATWIIRLMRSMIEYEWGFSIDERDDDGDEESDEVVKPVQDALNQVGATTLCLDLIAPGMDLRLMLEAVKQNGWALGLAAEALKADKEVVLEAVKTNGRALRFASDDLKADRDVVRSLPANCSARSFCLITSSEEEEEEEELEL